MQGLGNLDIPHRPVSPDREMEFEAAFNSLPPRRQRIVDV
jgi:hypothetical protein